MKYVIPGKPIPLARPRFSNGHVFDSQKSEKLAAAIYLRFLHGARPFYEGALFLDVIFYMQPPKKNKNIWHAKKPDLDNLLKFIADVANGILYEDDGQIAKITAEKVYGKESKTEITITEL